MLLPARREEHISMHILGMWGLGFFRVWGLGCRGEAVELRTIFTWASGAQDQDVGVWEWVQGFRLQGFGSEMPGPSLSGEL